MKEILEKANELGLLIKSADEYKKFHLLTLELENDTSSRDLLDSYIKLAGELNSRELNGDIIENFEKEGLENMADEISGNELIRRYLKAKDDYLNLLVDIQKSISEESNDDIY